MSSKEDTGKAIKLSSCVTCGTHFDMQSTPAPPFCSHRCQLIDLGRWMNEEISLPFEAEPEVRMDIGDDR